MESPDPRFLAPPALIYLSTSGEATQIDLDPLDAVESRELEVLLALLNHAGNQIRSEMRRRSKTSWTPT